MDLKRAAGLPQKTSSCILMEKDSHLGVSMLNLHSYDIFWKKPIFNVLTVFLESGIYVDLYIISISDGAHLHKYLCHNIKAKPLHFT